MMMHKAINSISYSINNFYNPLDTGRKLNVRKTFRRRPGQRQKDLHKWKYEKLSKLRGHVVMDLTAPVDKCPIH